MIRLRESKLERIEKLTQLLDSQENAIFTVLDSIPLALIIKDISNDNINTVYANPAWEELWKISIEELYEDASCWLKRVHPDDVERVEARYRDPHFFTQTFRVVIEEGSASKLVTLVTVPIQDKENQLVLIVKISIDVAAAEAIGN